MVRVYSISPRRKGIFGFDFNLTTKIIFINLIGFFIGYILLAIYGEDFFLRNIALTSSVVLTGGALWTFLTSMFMHGSFFHIFANMFSLFFIGNFLEKIIGRKRFI